jgi:flagellum-specific peptidoglycan hydrolase FlgJ
MPDGRIVTIEAKFISFPGPEECFEYHGRLITSPHGPYAAALPFRWTDWQKYVQMVGIFYATRLSYSADLIEIIKDSKIPTAKQS